MRSVKTILEKHRKTVTIRREMGSDIVLAARGQLRKELFLTKNGRDSEEVRQWSTFSMTRYGTSLETAIRIVFSVKKHPNLADFRICFLLQMVWGDIRQEISASRLCIAEMVKTEQQSSTARTPG